MASRRQFLARVAQGGVPASMILLSGCSSSDNGDSPDDGDPTDDGDNTQAPTPASTTQLESSNTEESTPTATQEPTAQTPQPTTRDSSVVAALPDIEFGTEFAKKDGYADFGGAEKSAGCGILTIYTAGGSESVPAGELKIVGSSEYAEDDRWGNSMHYNYNMEVSPEPRADSVRIRVGSTDHIKMFYLTDDGEWVMLQDLGKMSRYC